MPTPRPPRWLFALLSLAALGLSPALASPPEDSVHAKFCGRTRARVLELSRLPENRLSHANGGGFGGGGVCWWHSRLQRAALYLAVYLPDLPRPGREGAQAILDRLVRMDEVVTIPGFDDLASFTDAFADEVQDRLNRWQLEDAVRHMAWVRGMSGESAVSAEILEARVESILHSVTVDRKIQFNMLQMPGLPAHAWLVIGGRRVAGGALLEVIDSNVPGEVLRIYYRKGDTTLSLPYGWSFVPYLAYSSDWNRIERSFRSFCGRAMAIE